MKGVILVFLFICNTLWHHCVATQYPYPSNIRISILIVAPGTDFYSIFGHCAIHISIDPPDSFESKHSVLAIDSLDYDVVYNFGMFTPASDVYFDWLRGNMLFHLSKQTYSSFITGYEHQKRGVCEHVLALDSAQTMFIIHSLENNYKIYNRYYWYLFFHDNCTTRIRNLILQSYENLTLPEIKEIPTYRDQIHPYLKKYPWGKFVIDILFGLPLDQKTDINEQMFLPDNLNSILLSTLSNGHPIVKETIYVFEQEQSTVKSLCIITPIVICCFILVLSLLFSYIKKGAFIFDFALFFALGIVGMLITYLWFFSGHTTVAINNLNIIWALPSHLVMAFFLLLKRYSHFVCMYFLVTTIITSLLIVSWIFFPQRLNPELIPLVIAIALRGNRIFVLILKEKGNNYSSFFCL